MESILLPTDFSATSQNAAMYALKLAGQLGVKKLVLYHSYEIPLTIDPITPAIQMLDIESLKEASGKNILDFELKIKAFASGIEIVSISEYGALTAGVDEVCERMGAGLVVMGITGGNLLEEKLIGSNTLTVAKNTSTPVIIVPATVSFTRIEEIMLTGDFEEDTTIPLAPITNLLAETKAKLFVYNTSVKKDPGISYAIHKQLDNLHPEYHSSQASQYVESINDFAIEHKVDLVITVLRKHGFFEGLFSEDHTKMLAFHSHLPLMVIHNGIHE